MTFLRTFALLGCFALAGCGWTAGDRRALAEDAARLVIFKAAGAVRDSMERDGFTAEEVERFAAWLEKRAGNLADRILDRVKDD